MSNPKFDTQFLNERVKGIFPGLLGIKITYVEEGKLIADMPIKREIFASKDFLHAGSIVSFADTIAGDATMVHLPEGGKSFTTQEFKSNFIKAVREDKMQAECTPEHFGRITQVWHVTVIDQQTGEKITIFSCTQLTIY
jgi:uncharacterized protein (TIGR00369 family)